MASQVKLVKTDIRSKEKKALIENLAKHAFSSVLNYDEYKNLLLEKDYNLEQLLKLSSFRHDFLAFLDMQFIKGSMPNYVAVLGGQEFTVQVKYSKGSMARFSVCNLVLLMYEVPYITVPSLADAVRVQDSEIQDLKQEELEEVRVKSKLQTIFQQKYEGMELVMETALKETACWLKHSKKEDPRRDNLAGVFLSRFYAKSKEYSWHVVVGKLTEENSKSGQVLCNHSARIQQKTTPEDHVKFGIHLGFFVQLTARFEMENEAGKRTPKKLKLLVFNQTCKPQTSIESTFGGIKNLSIKSFFSTNFLAILAFLCFFLIVYLQGRICEDFPATRLKQMVDDRKANIIREEDETLMEKFCYYKQDFVANLGVAFLLLTVIRQVIKRMSFKNQRSG